MSTLPESHTEEELNHIFAEACAAQADGRYSEAEKGYRLLLGYFPEAVVLHCNLGLVHYSRGDFSDALREFSLAHDLLPGDGDILFNLALSQKKTGDIRAAIASFTQLLTISPDLSDGWYNLAGCYRDLHDDDQALCCYHQVLLRDAGYLPAINNLAYINHRRGEVEEAKRWYRQLLSLRPEDDAARYMLASLCGTPLECAPDAYVRTFFDSYAEGFEESLVEGLGYDTPRQLRDCLVRCSVARIQYTRGLDLGCGTGLAGVAFNDVVPLLDGVDLSGNMLNQAARKGIYSELHQDSIGSFLQNAAHRYDLFLATDVFIYVGELHSLFTDLCGVALPAAIFCFSTEHLEGKGYRLQQTGRFAYSAEYVRAVAAATGWSVQAEEETRLRRERGEWLMGRLWVLCRDEQGA